MEEPKIMMIPKKESESVTQKNIDQSVSRVDSMNLLRDILLLRIQEPKDNSLFLLEAE
jgi:hypothetical protein